MVCVAHLVGHKSGNGIKFVRRGCMCKSGLVDLAPPARFVVEGG